MDRFRNLLRSMDRSSNPPNTPVAIGSTSDVPDRSSGGALSSLLSNRQSQSHSQPQPQPQSHSESQSQSQQNPAHPRSSNRQWAGVTQYSSYSTQGPFHTRMFVSENFMLGAGAVIIQPSSGKVVIVQEGNYWFLPKGRKDLGESIEQAALREAYEEVRVPIYFQYPPTALTCDRQSGYQCEFLPLYHWTNAPVQSRHVCRQKHTEPLHITITSYSGRRSRPPGEYLTFWYVCQIGPDAVS